MQTIILTRWGLRWLMGDLFRRKEARASLCRKLGRRKVITLSGHGDQRIRCVAGLVWITGVDAGGDVILRQGAKILGGRRRIVIEALEDSVVEISVG